MLPAWLALLLIVTGAGRFLVVCDAEHHDAQVELAHLAGHCDHEHAPATPGDGEDVPQQPGHTTEAGCDEPPCTDLPLGGVLAAVESRPHDRTQPAPAAAPLRLAPPSQPALPRLGCPTGPPGPDPRLARHRTVVLRI